MGGGLYWHICGSGCFLKTRVLDSKKCNFLPPPPPTDAKEVVMNVIVQHGVDWDNILFRCSCSPWGNMKVVYGKSKHQQRSAPSELPLDDLPEILELEEMLCEANPNLVNAYLIRKNWGSGHLRSCWENGSAFFVLRGADLNLQKTKGCDCFSRKHFGWIL